MSVNTISLVSVTNIQDYPVSFSKKRLSSVTIKSVSLVSVTNIRDYPVSQTYETILLMNSYWLLNKFLLVTK